MRFVIVLVRRLRGRVFPGLDFSRTRVFLVAGFWPTGAATVHRQWEARQRRFFRRLLQVMHKEVFVFLSKGIDVEIRRVATPRSD
jgi:hypothetical protein